MILPDAQRLYAVIDATWPAAAQRQVGPWTIRDGKGGGSRVSAATLTGTFEPNVLQLAEDAMRALDQTPLFMIRDGDNVLDAALADASYKVKDPVTLYAAPIADIATERPDGVFSFAAWPPLEIQQEIWCEGGIGPERIKVMSRAGCAKTTLLCRADERCAGSAYIGIDGEIAMIHALEIGAGFRRRGLARKLTVACAFWAKAQGAQFLTLATTDANVAANALYTSLGMTVVGQYHYRILLEG